MTNEKFFVNEKNLTVEDRKLLRVTKFMKKNSRDEHN